MFRYIFYTKYAEAKAKADAEAKGLELAIEHVIRSTDKVSKIHEKEQKLIQKLTRNVNTGL